MRRGPGSWLDADWGQWSELKHTLTCCSINLPTHHCADRQGHDANRIQALEAYRFSKGEWSISE
jgi:hypothetical protein